MRICEIGFLGKVEMKSNHLVVGSLVVLALSVAYYLLLYLPKQQELRLQQQEITLRKQTYEVCQKEEDESIDKITEFFIKENPVITKQELGEKLIPVITKRDELVANCVEKRLQEYRK